MFSYPARSVFKLKEIDYKMRIFKPGDRVIDLGCSPGSWTMFAAERVGPSQFEEMRCEASQQTEEEKSIRFSRQLVSHSTHVWFLLFFIQPALLLVSI